MSFVKPLVSVILPVYQGEAIVLNAVRSVLAQTYQNLELIVINDGSTDNTLQVLSVITDPRLKILTQENHGVAVARNLGIAHSQGEYLSFIDADDVWFPEKTEAELTTIERHGQPVCLVYSWYYGVDDQNRLVNVSPAFKESGQLLETMLNHESVMLPSTTLLHRSIAEAVGGFPTESYHEDRTFFIQACKDFPAFATEKRLVIYRQSMDGRCRRILKYYDKALAAELSILSPLKDVLSADQLSQLRKNQLRSLLFRFLMYDFVSSAQTLYNQIREENGPSLLQSKSRSLKSLLAWLSLTLGVNTLYICRISIQGCTRQLTLPWWKKQSRAAYNSLTP